MKLKFTLTTALLVCFLTTARGGFLNGDCELKRSNGREVEYMEWVYDLFLQSAIQDTEEPGTEIARFSTKNIELITGRQSKYVSLQLANGYLILTLNDEFASFEEQETEPDITIVVEFKCKDGTARIKMWGTVEDSNNHAPEFKGSLPYLYTLPLPFPPSIPLGCVTGVVVSAIDVDLSTTRIDFEITDTDWLQVSGTWKLGRTFYVNITTSRYITAALSATLKATDNGVPQQSTETKLHVLPDLSRSLPAFTSNIPSSVGAEPAMAHITENEELEKTPKHTEQ